VFLGLYVLKRAQQILGTRTESEAIREALQLVALCDEAISPAYSPELNLIEILWRRIKYSWLPFSAYESLSALIEALETILCDVGSEYQITFA
jgi:hypothetical protein